jgi:hypothetical protein
MVPHYILFINIGLYMKILSVIFIVCNFIALPTQAWEKLIKMLDEAEKATSSDFKKLKPIYSTREEASLALSKINPSPTPSQFYERYKEKALALIAYHTEFNGHGIKAIPPWKQIAYITLGTDDMEQSLIGFVVLGDIRGLPSFQDVLRSLNPPEEKGGDFLSIQFEAMRLT